MTWTTPEPHPGICCWNAAGWLHQQWGNDQWMLVIVLSALSIFLHFIPNQIWSYYRDTIVILPEFFRQDLTELNAPTRLAKAQGGPLKFLTNPLRYSMVPAGHWCAKIRCAGHTSRGRQLSSRGDLPQVLASVMGKVWEIYGNIWKYDDYTIGFRDVEIVSLLDKPILGENDGFFSQIDGGMGRISNLFMSRLGSMRIFFTAGVWRPFGLQEWQVRIESWRWSCCFPWCRLDDTSGL